MKTNKRVEELMHEYSIEEQKQKDLEARRARAMVMGGGDDDGQDSDDEAMSGYAMHKNRGNSVFNAQMPMFKNDTEGHNKQQMFSGGKMSSQEMFKVMDLPDQHRLKPNSKFGRRQMSMDETDNDEY